MKVIDLFNHCKLTVKLLTRLGAMPTNWYRFYDIYNDYLKYGATKTGITHNIGTRECYRARDAMKLNVNLTYQEKQQLIEELKYIIELLTKN